MNYDDVNSLLCIAPVQHCSLRQYILSTSTGDCPILEFVFQLCEKHMRGTNYLGLLVPHSSGKRRAKANRQKNSE